MNRKLTRRGRRDDEASEFLGGGEPPTVWPSNRRLAELPITSTARENIPADAERVTVTIRDIRTREKGFIFGLTAEPRASGDGESQAEVFLHRSSFDPGVFDALEPGMCVSVLLTLGPKGFKGLAGVRVTEGNR